MPLQTPTLFLFLIYFYLNQKEKKSSYLIIQQFFLKANVYGVKRSSSARSLVFVWVHVKVLQGLVVYFFS